MSEFYDSRIAVFKLVRGASLGREEKVLVETSLVEICRPLCIAPGTPPTGPTISRRVRPSLKACGSERFTFTYIDTHTTICKHEFSFQSSQKPVPSSSEAPPESPQSPNPPPQSH
ncbi:uncharacterized protein LOC113005170 [Solenopsis invicta]|uniref:uncharacterized protein LOC113005170 n=1 Tax=Solenopsis invicta TaxID=13686 RepID=UPI000E340408|nr:uncharacterized protein LOC113005170 [Solenopsis invicta]